MERLKHVKETLMSVIESQMAHIHDVDAQELGEAIDMIKDIEEAIYYCTVVEAMKEPRHQEPYYEGDMDRGEGRMYYDGGRRYPQSRSYQNDYYPSREHPMELSRDAREGRSP